MKSNQLNVLLITSRWPVDKKEIDGGCMTALNICDALSGVANIDLLIPQVFSGIPINFAKKIMYYKISNEEWKLLRGIERFRTRINVAKAITKSLLPLFPKYDKIIILHVFHCFDICNHLTEEQLKKIVLFPMFLSTSYLKSNENVPTEYINLEKNVLKKVCFIITPSLFEAGILMRDYDVVSKSVTVIPRYINPIFESRESHAINSDKIKFCIVGNIKKQKQNILSLTLLKKIISREIDAELHIVGAIHDGEEYNSLKTYLLNERMENRVVFHGIISQEELCLLFKDIHFMISVSACETFGRSIIEGLSSGVPAIVLDVIECFKSLIGENNGVVFASNINQMSDIICTILRDNKAYQDLSKQALAYSKTYTRDNILPLLKHALL